MPTRGELIASGVIGVGASTVASYVYAGLADRDVPLIVLLGATIVAAVVAFGVARVSPQANLLLRSALLGYHPRGQNDYIKQVIRDLNKSRSIVVVGARGFDLIGPRSPLGKALRVWTGEIKAYVLHPDSTHVRLRSGALDVEREHYKAELRSVIASLQLISLQAHSSVSIFLYDAQPRFRIIALDKVAYVAPYSANTQGIATPTYRVRLNHGQVRQLLDSYIASLCATPAPSIPQSALEPDIRPGHQP
jgi:hypothetical protein